MKPRVYSSEYRWVILALSSLGFTITWIIRASYSPLVEEIRVSLGLTYSEAGLIMSLFWIGYNLTQIPSGIISDRIGVKITYSVAILLTGIFTFLRGSASSFADLAIFTFIVGLTCGFSWAPAASIIIRWFSPKDRSISIGIFSSSASIGILTALVSSPLISSIYGSWRWSFWILSVPAFLASILMFLFFKEYPPESDAEQIKNEEAYKTKDVLIKIVRSRDFWLISVVMGGLSIISSGAMTWTPSYLITVFRVTPTVAGALVSVSSVVSIFSGPSAGFASDKILKRKTPILFASVFLDSLAFLSISALGGRELALTLPLIYIGTFFGSMGFAINIPILADWFPSTMVGTASGFLNFTGGLGAILGPWLFGTILEASNTYSLSWVTLAMVALTSSIFTVPLILRETRK